MAAASDKAGDAAIMIACMTGAPGIAKQNPTLAGKPGAVIGGLVVATAAITTKNVVGNLTEDLGKTKKFLPENLSNYMDYLNLNDLFNLTGNFSFDLLLMLIIYQNIELFFICLLIYNLIIFLLPDFLISKYELFLLKILHAKLVSFYIRSIRV